MCWLLQYSFSHALDDFDMDLELVRIFIHDKHAHITNKLSIGSRDPWRLPAHKLESEVVEVHLVWFELAVELDWMLER